MVLGIAVALVVVGRGSGTPETRKVPEVTLVKLQPPPPPPPPPRPVEQPKMIEQPKMEMPEFKPQQPRLKDEPPPKDANAAKPPGPPGLDAAAEGPGDAFNLAGIPGGSGLLGGGGGSRWGWYSGPVQQQVEEALREHRKTRSSKLQVQVRLWADGGGRVTRASLVRSTGDRELDGVIENEVLGGLQLKQPPPKDMPMPIVMRVTARRQ